MNRMSGIDSEIGWWKNSLIHPLVMIQVYCESIISIVFFTFLLPVSNQCKLLLGSVSKWRNHIMIQIYIGRIYICKIYLTGKYLETNILEYIYKYTIVYVIFFFILTRMRCWKTYIWENTAKTRNSLFYTPKLIKKYTLHLQ